MVLGATARGFIPCRNKVACIVPGLQAPIMYWKLKPLVDVMLEMQYKYSILISYRNNSTKPQLIILIVLNCVHYNKYALDATYNSPY